MPYLGNLHLLFNKLINQPNNGLDNMRRKKALETQALTNYSLWLVVDLLRRKR
jgi:hypothetical protein